jgi:hypothetical protein
VQERAEVWDAPRTTLVGDRVQVKPAGDTADVKATVPVNPLAGATVTVDVAGAPAMTVTVEGLAERVKSVTVKEAVVEWVRAGLVLVPVILRL